MAGIQVHSAVLFGVAGACVLAALTPTSEARAPRSGQGREPESVALEEVVGDPHAWLGRAVRFTGQLHSLPPEWNPWLTRFGTESYLAVRLWGDEQRLWNEQDYDHPAATVFARRGSEPARLLATAPVYARFELVGVVRQVFFDRPWIEILSARALPRQLGEGAVLHASRAVNLAQNEQWELAAEEFARARAGDLPENAARELEQLEGWCRQRATQHGSQ